MNCRRFLCVSGSGKLSTYKRFSSVNEVPVADTTCPTYSTSVRPNLVYLRLTATLNSCSLQPSVNTTMVNTFKAQLLTFADGSVGMQRGDGTYEVFLTDVNGKLIGNKRMKRLGTMKPTCFGLLDFTAGYHQTPQTLSPPSGQLVVYTSGHGLLCD